MTHPRTLPALISGPTLSRRAVLHLGTAGAALWLWGGPTHGQSAPVQARTITYGADPDFTGPTEADLYVASNGDDAAQGTYAAPLRTIQRGVDLLAGRDGGSLAIRGGLYREAVNLEALQGRPGSPFILHRYGTETVTISAAEPVPNWQPLSQEDADMFWLDPVQVITATLPPGTVAEGRMLALNLHENGQWRPLAADTLEGQDPRRIGDSAGFRPARYVINADNRIEAIDDFRLTGLPAAHLDQAQVMIYHGSNRVARTVVAAFDPSLGRITPEADRLRPKRRDGVVDARYMLCNTPQGLNPGHWMARQQVDGSVTVYYHRAPDTSDTPDIEVSLRTYCIEFGTAQYVELWGLTAIRASGTGRYSGNCIRRNDLRDQPRSVGLKLRHCRAGQGYSSGGGAMGAIAMTRCDDLALEHISVFDCINSFGLFLNGCTEVDLRHFHARGISKAPGRFFNTRNMIFAFSHLEYSAWDTHANAFNFYERCDQVLIYGVKTRELAGYVTYQESSRIHFAFCEFTADLGGNGRVLVSQNRNPGAGQGGPDDSGDPVLNTTFFYWNLTLPRDPRRDVDANSLSLGPGGTSHRHAIFNSILHGGGFSGIYAGDADPVKEIRSHNLYTGLSWWQRPRNGWYLGEGEATGDQGLLTAQMRGRDLSQMIAQELRPAFPRFDDWDLDIDGYVVDWSQAPVGCRVSRG